MLNIHTSHLINIIVLTSPLGSADIEGFRDGSSLGGKEGCAVGQSETDGWSEGAGLGDVLSDGVLEGIDEGRPEVLGTDVGLPVGADVGLALGEIVGWRNVSSQEKRVTYH